MAKRQLKVNNSNLITYLKQNILLFLGLILISVFFVWRYHNARILSFNTKEVAKIDSSSVKPIHIKAYPVGVDVDIKPAVITKGVWPVFPDTAGYVINNNNVIIYGHNKNNVLGPIRWISLGTIIEIKTSDGKLHKYKVEKVDTIDPDNLSYIEKKDEETLTVYTCTGFLDSKRLVVVAFPI